VIVLNSLPGFNLIDGGKVGVLNAVLERTQVFHPGDRNNKQAQGTVLALGRVEGNISLTFKPLQIHMLL